MTPEEARQLLDGTTPGPWEAESLTHDEPAAPDMAETIAGMRTVDERPDLLELYTRRPVKIKPLHITSDRWVTAASILAFGTIVFMSLVMCL